MPVTAHRLAQPPTLAPLPHPSPASGRQEANLWDVSDAPTIVATQRGARLDFQARLRAKGVEVLEFDFLTPDAVARRVAGGLC